MCGILGQIAFSNRGRPLQREEIFPRLIALMARRGPDDEGLWSDGRQCVLAFRRLAILDLSEKAHQPMLTPDGRYVLVYNGEVYNFRELRRELEQKGVQFHSKGDSEVVLHALAHWGNRALDRFNGMFALGFYDTLEGRLLLARDHAGIKPLYYMLTPQGLAFASQYDQILAHGRSHHLAVSSAALALYMRLGYIPAPYALLDSTHMLEPGCWLDVSTQSHVRHGRFFEFAAGQEGNLRGDEAFEAVDAAVTAAVRRQLVSDVPVGTFLSGGIDSPLVAAKIQAVSCGKVRAFTIGTNGDRHDESADAMAYAQEIGVEHVVQHVTSNTALEMLDDVVAACGEPFADYSMFPTMLVSQLARHQVKVMLSGDGGDELFWGYFDRFASVLEKVDGYAQSSSRQNSGWNLQRLLRTSSVHQDLRWPGSIGDIYRLKHTHSEGWLKRIFPDLAGWPADFSLFTYTGLEPDQTARWLRWNEFVGHLTMILLKVDRASMYQSLEVRVPLLDKEVVEVATRVDWRSCLDVKRKLGKLPLRHSLARHVRHQTSIKRGFTVPMDAWLRGPLGSVFEAAVLERDDILGLPLNKVAAREIFDRHLSGQANFDGMLWMLLSLALWEQRHFTARSRTEFTERKTQLSA